ncbi:hypothetical protein Tco_1366900, partial [Tanacetum coccineum]
DLEPLVPEELEAPPSLQNPTAAEIDLDSPEGRPVVGWQQRKLSDVVKVVFDSDDWMDLGLIKDTGELRKELSDGGVTEVSGGGGGDTDVSDGGAGGDCAVSGGCGGEVV